MSYTPTRLDPAVIAPIEAALGADQVAVATIGQLIEVLSRLPADTPLTVAEYTMAAAGLSYADEEETLAVVRPAALTTRTSRGPSEIALYDPPLVAGVELGACRIAEGAPLPQDMTPWCPHERVVAMMHAGEPVAMLDGCQQLVDDVAGWLGRDDESLLEWTADTPDLRDQIEIEGLRLAHAARRLAQLRDQIAAYEDECRDGTA
ncbi:hypothetical protein ACIA5A_30575 [Micromonospora sp. NPDC051300]|uniref:hypothetical protein n=1 Tax=Micromonospora sp. NPDC051300 TaxID=3364286 RepID=UPI0037A0C592